MRRSLGRRAVGEEDPFCPLIAGESKSPRVPALHFKTAEFRIRGAPSQILLSLKSLGVLGAKCNRSDTADPSCPREVATLNPVKPFAERTVPPRLLTCQGEAGFLMVSTVAYTPKPYSNHQGPIFSRFCVLPDTPTWTKDSNATCLRNFPLNLEAPNQDL